MIRHRGKEERETPADRWEGAKLMAMCLFWSILVYGWSDNLLLTCYFSFHNLMASKQSLINPYIPSQTDGR